ncbi:hypothetical protein OIU34_12320 [Pararhizobium sp. BT-229]|uniref:hypothetical protein n=1 Tax=Pararhizobium sp. BT-229 TaxID=2986923 RepID=UPI0021F7A5A2|nr:hypothetical protein [Pararhizobium sp. BT-229]MCV9962686.1 hypothetical protein [Pararhizobium sp. BT-229]
MSSLSNQREPSAGSSFAAASGGRAVARAAHWLSLAAAPTFALMALLTSGEADMICSPDAFPLSGMATMYLLMSAFHLPPWLRLLSGRAVR